MVPRRPPTIYDTHKMASDQKSGIFGLPQKQKIDVIKGNWFRKVKLERNADYFGSEFSG